MFAWLDRQVVPGGGVTRSPKRPLLYILVETTFVTYYGCSVFMRSDQVAATELPNPSFNLRIRTSIHCCIHPENVYMLFRVWRRPRDRQCADKASQKHREQTRACFVPHNQKEFSISYQDYSMCYQEFHLEAKFCYDLYLHNRCFIVISMIIKLHDRKLKALFT